MSTMKSQSACSADGKNDVAGLAGAIVEACGLGRVLDVGAGDGRLTEALLRQGVDARGVDQDEVRTSAANARVPGRFVCADVCALPFADGEFDTVVSDGCLECLDDEGVRAALAEIRRVGRSHVVLRLRVCSGEDGVIRSRAWWERMCFAAGFRKHTHYYKLNPYDSLNYDGEYVVVVLERMSDVALAQYPLSALEEERGLHMDMMRDTGERSDAHIIRYQWACDFIRPQDRVLDAACGLGYGGHVIRALTRASSVIGIDGSEYAVDYANLCYGEGERGTYVCGYLPQALHAYPDASFDAVISFETLEHVEDPQALLAEFERVLTPGGRVIVSVPNDWSDETGEDPNPFHLQVYDLDRLRTEVGEKFDVESVVVQSASQAKVVGQRFVWERKQRELYPIDPRTREPWSAEWWLMVGMKSPFAEAPYEERVFANVASSGHPSVQYAEEYLNPWLGLSMITIDQRASNSALRAGFAARVLEHAPPVSSDYGAALCVRAYALMEGPLPPVAEVESLLVDIDRYIAQSADGRMPLRWRVSLAFVKAAVLRAQGQLEQALDAFVACAQLQAGTFGVHLLTKTTASWFEAGRLALALGDADRAKQLWMRGLEVGHELLSVSLQDVLLVPEHPNLFNHGDGVREYTLAWDNLARCANGVHLLAAKGAVDMRSLQASFSGEYETVTGDLRSAREQLRERDLALGALRSEIHGRTLRLEVASSELLGRTEELVSVRETLVERTRMLEAANSQLSLTRAELASVRETLIERTRLLEGANSEVSRTQELVSVRETLVERTHLLEGANSQLLRTQAELTGRTQELIEARNVLAERTGLLEASNDLLAQRTAKLDETAAELHDRAERLEAAYARAEELHGLLVDRTGRLESACADLDQLRLALDERQAMLEERTRALDLAATELEDRTKRLESGIAPADRKR